MVCWWIKEAKPFETVVVASKEKLQSHSKGYTVPDDANFHCTSNNTILELK
jgi:hypothetical protein